MPNNSIAITTIIIAFFFILLIVGSKISVLWDVSSLDFLNLYRVLFVIR